MGCELFDAAAAYRLAWGTRSVPVRRIWRGGLALDPGAVRHMPGRVRLLRGAEHVATGLLVSDGIEGGEHRFRFKTLAFADAAPARDYAADGAAPPPRRGPQRIGL